MAFVFFVKETILFPHFISTGPGTATDLNSGHAFDPNPGPIICFEPGSILNLETLRKWPPAPNPDRYCQKRYNLGKPHEKATKDVYLEEGSVVVIPVWPIHYDPKYYPDPHRFDPERFSDENKHNIKPFTYLPFGVGPRNCIGSRFAIIEVKAMVFDLLRHFELSPAPKTRVPAKLDPSQFAMRFLGGHWIRIKPRDVKA
ncbi:Cytochrome P450 9e2 [Eumeta japonica]|uniref:unspecific monooxygenase n=1 Tax=Eumeta variegata TaxID=151549 RepID=A0A4C1UJY8_EUMVA|nr:Cytochrome P450 9e2 [Eumeta japonica]